MAQEQKRNTTSTQPPKRLARAKIRRPETPLDEAQRKEERKKRLRNIAIGAFAVLLALSMMVPSFVYVVSGMRQAKTTSEARELADALSSGEEVSSEQVDKLYQEAAESYEETLKASPNDTETLLQLGNLYLTWGSAVNYYATDDGASDHAVELYSKAEETYDRYLALEDSTDVRVNRALSSLYQGKITDAQTQLESIVAEHPDCSSAWANLGQIYEWFNPDEAITAYQNAVDTDPEGVYGTTSYAQSRLDALTAPSEESDEASAADESGEAQDVSDASEATEAESEESADYGEDAYDESEATDEGTSN